MDGSVDVTTPVPATSPLHHRNSSHSMQSESHSPASRGQSTNKSSGVRTRGHGRSRPRASLACMNCRQRKIKCNMSTPGPNASCTSCRSLHIPCLVSRDGDRRKAGSREQVASLQDRIQLLESLVRRTHDHAPLKMHESEAATMSSPVDLEQHPLPSILTQPSNSSLGNASAPNMTMEFYESSPGPHTHHLDEVDKEPSMLPGGQLNAFNLHASQAEYDLNFSEDLTTRLSGSQVTQPFQTDAHQTTDLGMPTPLSDKNGSRLDVDEDFGEPRYYGPTCQLHIQCRDLSPLGESIHMDSEQGVSLKLDSSPLHSILFDTFWKSQPLSIAIVDQDSFQVGRRARVRSQYYSNFLENCILACASRMSTSAGVRALGSKYVEKAKTEIVFELEYPNIATLQGFLLLSDFEATRGRDRLGYMYCGISCRLAFDFGLPESCADLVAQGKISTSEAYSRYILFHGLFVYDKLWALYLGRASAIPISVMEAVHQRTAGDGWLGSTTLEAWVGLCTDISEVTDVSNSSPMLDTGATTHLAGLDAKICRRLGGLQGSLALRGDEISELDANAYGLHVQFHGIRIVLNKLLISTAQQNTGKIDAKSIPSPQENRSIDSEHLRSIMHESAIHIARLVSAYYQIFGIENVITVMLDNMYVAAAVLISHILRLQRHKPTLSVDRDVQWLRILADMLLKAQKHYPVAARMRSTLAGFVESTPMVGMFGSWAQTNVPSNLRGGAIPHKTKVWNVDPHPCLLTLDQRQDLEAHVGDSLEEPNDSEFQGMDVRNMMSWVLSER